MTESLHDTILKLIRDDVKRIRLNRLESGTGLPTEALTPLINAVRAEDQVDLFSVLNEMPTLYQRSILEAVHTAGMEPRPGHTDPVSLSDEEKFEIFSMVLAEEDALSDIEEVTPVVAAIEEADAEIDASSNAEFRREATIIAQMTMGVAQQLAATRGGITEEDGMPVLDLELVKEAAGVVANQTGVPAETILEIIMGMSE